MHPGRGLPVKLEGPLVSTEWLAAHRGAPALRIYDTTVYLEPNSGGYGYQPRSGREDWQRAHIPGAGFLDLITELSDQTRDLGFMMLPPAEFAARMAAHGAGDDSAVVLYNAGFPMWATRLWWMLRSIGFDNV